MDKDVRILVAGSRGLVGSAIVRRLEQGAIFPSWLRPMWNYSFWIGKRLRRILKKKSLRLWCRRQLRWEGILANNTYPAEFIHQNLTIQNNIIHQSWLSSVRKLIFLGSSCIYPKLCDQPMKEVFLMTGALEPTNSPYAVAKIAGIEMCWAYNRQYGTNFIPVMPTNLYVPNDNFDLETSHVFPTLIRKFHEAKEKGAKELVVWGTGTPKREFLHVDDLADACCFLLEYEIDLGACGLKPLYNIGTGKEVSIGKLAETIKEAVGFSGGITYDRTKPDGTPRKLLDVSRMLKLGWQAGIDLKVGIKETYQWFQQAVVD